MLKQSDFEYISPESPNCDLELEDSIKILSQVTLTHYDVSLYQVWLQKVWRFRKYYPDKG